MYKDSGYAGARHVSPGGFGQLRCVRVALKEGVELSNRIYYSAIFSKSFYAHCICAECVLADSCSVFRLRHIRIR